MFYSKKKNCGMLLFETLKIKKSDFLNSNTCFYSRLYGMYFFLMKMFAKMSWTLSRHTPVNQMLSNIQCHFLMSKGRHCLVTPLSIKPFLIYVRTFKTLTRHKAVRFSLNEHYYFDAPAFSRDIQEKLKLRFVSRRLKTFLAEI